MNGITLVIGGCRSGKSRYALDTAEGFKTDPLIFIATSVPQDEEMKERVCRHQEERGHRWKTVEAPVRLAEAVDTYSRKGAVILVDCITLWLSNLMMEDDGPGFIPSHMTALEVALVSAQCPVILVTNEVGTGIVPENRLARRYRDFAGTVNQKLARCAHHVIWVVAGIPVSIKGEQHVLGP